MWLRGCAAALATTYGTQPEVTALCINGVGCNAKRRHAQQ